MEPSGGPWENALALLGGHLGAMIGNAGAIRGHASAMPVPSWGHLGAHVGVQRANQEPGARRETGTLSLEKTGQWERTNYRDPRRSLY